MATGGTGVVDEMGHDFSDVNVFPVPEEENFISNREEGSQGEAAIHFNATIEKLIEMGTTKYGWDQFTLLFEQMMEKYISINIKQKYEGILRTFCEKIDDIRIIKEEKDLIEFLDVWKCINTLSEDEIYSLKLCYLMEILRKATGDIKQANTQLKDSEISLVDYSNIINASILKLIAARYGAAKVLMKIEDDGEIFLDMFSKLVSGIVLPEIAPQYQKTNNYTVTLQYINCFRAHIRAIESMDEILTSLVASILFFQHNGNRCGMLGSYFERELQCAFIDIQKQQNKSYASNDISGSVNVYQPDRGQYLGHNIAAIAVRLTESNEVEILGHEFNHITLFDNHMEHAEMRLLRALRFRNIPLKTVTIYSSLEPCHQCFGSLLMNEVSRVCFLQMDFRIGLSGLEIMKREEPHAKMEYSHIPIGRLEADYLLYQAQCNYLSFPPFEKSIISFYRNEASKEGVKLLKTGGIPYFLCTDKSLKQFENCYHLLQQPIYENLRIAQQKSLTYLETVVGRLTWSNCGKGGKDEHFEGRCTFHQ